MTAININDKNEILVAANATISKEFYMGHPPQQYYKQLYAKTFSFTRETLKAKTMMTTDKCSIVGEVAYDISDPCK